MYSRAIKWVDGRTGKLVLQEKLAKQKREDAGQLGQGGGYRTLLIQFPK